jgi:membrane protease YdiL (CAAX protease family)
LSEPLGVAPPDMAEPEQPRLGVGDVPWNIGDAGFIGGLWILVTFFIGGVLLAVLQRVLSQTQAEALVLPITSLALVAVVLAFIGSRYPGAVPRLLGPVRPSWATVGIGIGAGIVALAVFAFGLGYLLELLARAIKEALPPVQETFQELARNQQTVPLLVIGSVVIAPIAEELFYRGVLFTALRKRFDLWPAMGLSGLVFGLTHYQNTLKGYLLVLLVIMPLGMFFAWLYAGTRTLVAPIIAHAVFNLVQVLILIRQG